MESSLPISGHRRFQRSLLSVSIALAGAAMASSAQASKTLEEVIVTASKRMESVQDIPYNISAITGDSLEAKGITDLTKLARIVPGLAFSDRGARSGLISSGLVIRGINAESARSHSPNSNVAVISTYINETPLFANVRLVDIERVEVLRGPQGTLYGSGSLGGTLRYIQREPDPSGFEARVSAELNAVAEGDDLGWKTDLMVNMPLSDNSAIRLNLGKEYQAGFIDQTRIYVLDDNHLPVLEDPNDILGSPGLYTTNDDANDTDIENARIHLYLETDNGYFNVSHHYQETLGDGAQKGTIGDELNSGSLFPETFSGDSSLTSLDVEYDLGFATLTVNLSSYENDTIGSSDSTGLYELFSFYPTYYGSSPRPLIFDLSTWNEEADIAEIRLNSDTDENYDWAIGFFYMDQDNTIGIEDSYLGYADYANACFDAGLPFGGVPCGYGSLFGVYANNGPLAITEENKDLAYISKADNNFKDKAIFGEFVYRLTDEWQVTLGARWFDQKYVSNAIAGLVYVPDLLYGATSVFEESDTLFKFNTSYDLDVDKMLYFTVSEGFRRGGANALGAAADEAVHTYGSDHTTNFELGIKGNIEHFYNYTVAAFYVDWTDIQLNTDCGSLALNCVINAGDAESKGIEAQIEGNVTENLSISGSFTYANAELKSLGPQTDFTSQSVEAGAQLPQSPEISASWSISYTQPFIDGLEVEYFLGGTYRDETESEISTVSVRTDAFTLWDAFVSVRSDDWTVRLFVDNMANEIGITGSEDPTRWGPRSRVNISRPRLIGVSGSYTF